MKFATSKKKQLSEAGNAGSVSPIFLFYLSQITEALAGCTRETLTHKRKCKAFISIVI